MKPPPKPKEVKSAEDLAASMLERTRHYMRNCRCPQCNAGCLQCEECDWCRENLRKLLLAAITAAPFFICNATADRDSIALMKKKLKARAAKTAAKAPHAHAKATRAKAFRKKAAAPKAIATRKPPVSIRTGLKGPRGGDSDRGLYVRFDTPAVKAQVKAAAEAQTPPVSMNAFIVVAALDWVAKQTAMPKTTEPAVAQAG